MKLTKGERFVAQATSGRWILTVLAGAAFFAFCISLAYVVVKQRVQFKPETIVAMFSAVLLVIQGVYKDYFQRDRNGHNADEQNPPGGDSMLMLADRLRRIQPPTPPEPPKPPDEPPSPDGKS